MASKKKSSRKKTSSKKAVPKESNFWPLSGAIALLVLAFLLLLGGFGTGGVLPTNLFDGAYWAFGWAAYLTPIALGYLGVLKFISEDRKIPLDKFVGMSATVIFSASWLHVVFVNKDELGEYIGGHGGEVGRAVTLVVLNALDRWPTSILFVVFAILALFYTFGISLKVLLKLFEPFKNKGDTDLNDLKTKASEFHLNEGVPVEHHSASRLGSLRQSAEKVAATDHEALTVASDPNWKLPGVDLLVQKQDKADAGDIEGNAEIIKGTFENFSIDVGMEGANIGPRVTQFTLKPPTGVKLTKMTALENNLALDLAATSIRMEAPIPGTRFVGIEVPNVRPAMVRIASLFQSREWQEAKSSLSIAVGKDISGKALIGDLDKMPHLLIAGQTGSGKSVMINSVITSLLYRNSPSDLKLILVDPKRVELKPYDGIPHLLTPVITEPEKCVSALKWVVAEMERRYKALSEVHCRDIKAYNNLKKEEGMPYVVIIIDELSDLMMLSARDVEALVVRIAQKSRAVGIHLVLATQRPSVNVITGLIKANVPARVAFTTASQVDSRTIIDQMGAEKLLNMGDMLYLTAEMPKPKRVQGALISEAETKKITDFIKKQREPEYDDEIISQPVTLGGRGNNILSDVDSADEPIFQDAVRVVVEAGKASTSLLQRRLRIGYGKAARLVETMEEQGIVGPADGSRPREVLVSSVDEVFGRNKLHEEQSVDPIPEPEEDSGDNELV